MCRTQRNTPRGSQILSLRQRALAQDDSKLHYYSAAQPALTFKKPASKFATIRFALSQLLVRASSSSLTRREAGENPALPRNCKRGK